MKKTKKSKQQCCFDFLVFNIFLSMICAKHKSSIKNELVLV